MNNSMPKINPVEQAMPDMNMLDPRTLRQRSSDVRYSTKRVLLVISLFLAAMTLNTGMEIYQGLEGVPKEEFKGSLIKLVGFPVLVAGFFGIVKFIDWLAGVKAEY
tara:strand:+ start:46956 stop:47273 length:318 start_codon:yes stop_codon:yes gene_type:complete